MKHTLLHLLYTPFILIFSCTEFTRTYDTHQDNKFFSPAELTLSVQDDNNDGYNDLSFNGKLISIVDDNISHESSIEVIFLFDRQTGQFNEKENYTTKYKLNE